MKLLETCLLLLFFFMSLLPAFSSPVSIAGILVSISFFLVSLISILSSSWYGYILFLVYIGGLLVLFIYVCMVSSNYSLSMPMEYIFMLVSSGLVVCLMVFEFSENKDLLGKNSWSAGAELVSSQTLPLFVSLVVLLLSVFLAIIRMIFGESSLLVDCSY